MAYRNPFIDDEAELALKLFGREFSETEFCRARRHNRLRWWLSMAIGIPLLISLVVSFGPMGFTASVVIQPGLSAVATWMFPGSKDHGTTIYRKFAAFREMKRHGRERRGLR